MCLAFCQRSSLLLQRVSDRIERDEASTWMSKVFVFLAAPAMQTGKGTKGIVARANISEPVSGALVIASWGHPFLPSSLAGARRFVSCDEALLLKQEVNDQSDQRDERGRGSIAKKPTEFLSCKIKGSLLPPN